MQDAGMGKKWALLYEYINSCIAVWLDLIISIRNGSSFLIKLIARDEKIRPNYTKPRVRMCWDRAIFILFPRRSVVIIGTALRSNLAITDVFLGAGPRCLSY